MSRLLPVITYRSWDKINYLLTLSSRKYNNNNKINSKNKNTYIFNTNEKKNTGNIYYKSYKYSKYSKYYKNIRLNSINNNISTHKLYTH